MDLRSVSVITRNVVASRSEADLLRVVCSLLVQTCNAEAAAIWLTHRNKGMTARPDHWFSNRIPIQLQSLVIDQNYLVGGLRGTGPYLKQVQALPPIDQTLQYIAAPLVFDGGIRGLLAAWALPDKAGALPDLIDLASQLTAIRLRTLTDASRMSEQQQSMLTAQQELLTARQHRLFDEQMTSAGCLAALLGLRALPSMLSAKASLGAAPPAAVAAIDRHLTDLSALCAALQIDPAWAQLTQPGQSVDLAQLASALCLRHGFQLAWKGPAPYPVDAGQGGPAIFRALILEVFLRMKSNQSLHINAVGNEQHAVFGLYADALSPALEKWADGASAETPPAGAESTALQLARLLAGRLNGVVRCTPREFDGVGGVLMLPRAAFE